MKKSATPESSPRKPPLSFVLLGHVDCGKSTIGGHLISSCGGIDPETMLKYENDSREVGKGSDKYAWILNQLTAERERGISIDTSFWSFESPKYSFTLIDAPGHRDFLRNMITGTSQADVALLIVDASEHSFEAGFEEGNSKEHALLAFTLGAKMMIVGINKMDACQYSENRYNEIKETVSAYLKRVGYRTILYIPISGWVGDNLIEKSDRMPWYQGPTLLEALDGMKLPTRYSDKPLRLPVDVVYRIGGVGTVPVGRISTGVLRQGMPIFFTHCGVNAEVSSLRTRCGPEVEISEASSGEHVAFSCSSEFSSLSDIKRGEVVSDPSCDPAKDCHDFQAQMIIMSHPGQIMNGYTPVLDIHTAHVAARFKIDEKMDRRTGKTIEINPPFVMAGDACLVTLEPLKPLVVEVFGEYPPLGRFAVRDMRQTVAVGVVKSVNKKDVFLGKGARNRSV
jgi:elongation factor 1-alpha